ncbi:MAG: hypothetical protein HOV67_15390 [Kribbellaceae bacterium]|nr:hypothetical protein [Kribbellaceae bacterium]
MVNLSRTTLRGFAAVGALAGFAAMALPNAQAAQTSSTNTTAAAIAPAPVDSSTSKPQSPPPAGDMLTTKSSTTNVVRYNRLYKTGAIPASKCKEVNVSLRTAAGVEAYVSQLDRCIYAAWALPLKQAGAAYKVAPKLIFTTSYKVNSPCGLDTTGRAFQCAAGGRSYIYFPVSPVISYWKQSPTFARAYASFTIAHEYGHHVQWLTGILNASWERQYYFSTQAAKLEESRRRELQASCLGGAVLGANKRYYPWSGGLMTQFNYLVSHSGDQPGYPRDHGSMKNHAFWVTAGFNARHSYTIAGNCNTWNASSTYVA